MTGKDIPQNEKGVHTDTVTEEKFISVEDAKQHYLTVKDRFLNINQWQEIAGKGTAKFTLRNNEGKEKTGTPKEGDYFEINIPAPSSEAGEGADWVRVIKTEEVNTQDESSFAIIVKPSQSPISPEDVTAHFFDSEATSTFIIRRNGNIVSAEVHGRNETPNNEDPGFKDKVRNTIVAIGAMLGFSKIQWKSLVNGLVQVNDGERD